MEQARPQLVLLGAAILLDKTIGLECLENPVNGGAGELETLGEFAHAKPARTAGEGSENRRRSVDRLDGRIASRPWIRHC